MTKSVFVSDTIVALATPPGRGAIAVVRVSGPDAYAIGSELIDPWPIPPRVATLCRVQSREGLVLDEAIITCYQSPRSFTGEDTIEIATHGGWSVPVSVIGAIIEAGGREATPGEFTRRAVLNGKIDLLQAEAIGDLIDSRSRGSQRVALTQLEGGLSRQILALRESLLELEALIAYDIDFPEEDDGPISPERVLVVTDRVLAALSGLLLTANTGELVREGALVVIAGLPNVGKSSLFNALVGYRRAIVTDIPGTTRDAVETVIDGGNWPIRLVDTAGLRTTADVVEKLGIEVSEAYVAQADVILACGDDAESLVAVVDTVAAWTDRPTIAVRTKIDRGRLPRPPIGGTPLVETSAEQGIGLNDLVQAIAATLREMRQPIDLDAPILTRARHRSMTQQAYDELIAFREAWDRAQLPASVAAVHVRAAIHALEELVGVIDVDDVLDRLFADFCVGK